MYNWKSYHHNVLKHAVGSSGDPDEDSILYKEGDSLKSLQDDLQDMEDSLENFCEKFLLELP